LRQVRSLKIVFSDDICYPYKYSNRDRINRLFEQRGECDDILVVKYGKITDASYANVIFRNTEGEWYTPSSFLLPGTRRASLLKKRVIREATITYSDISKYTEVKLINAMIDINDTVGIPVGNLIVTS
jgi:4-amino-4-deoxychorismate lyase